MQRIAASSDVAVTSVDLILRPVARQIREV